MREIDKLWIVHLRTELEELMKAQGNQVGEKVQEKISRDRTIPQWASLEETN